MRILAIDYGTRRIGVAVSDELGLTTRGVATIQRTGDRAAVDEISRLASELEVERVVVGMPLRADGSAGDAAARVEEFVGALRESFAIPVETIGEYLSSREAEDRLRSEGASPSDVKKRVDEMAARVILEEYLAVKERRADG